MNGRCSESKIREVVRATFPKWSYVFASWYDADRIVSKSRKLPVVVCLLPVSGQTIVRNGRTIVGEDVAVAFLDKVERDATGEENADAYIRMRDASENFIRALNATGEYEPVTDWQFSVVYERMSTIVTGVMLSFRLTEAVGRC